MSTFEFALAGATETVAYAFPAARFTIGSAPSVGLRFDQSLVQAQHAEVALDPKGVPWIRDLTNQNQLWVNGQPLAKSALTVGAVVRLGNLELIVRRRAAPSEVKLDATAKRPTPFASPPVQKPFSSQPLAIEPAGAAPASPRISSTSNPRISSTSNPALDSTAKRPSPFATPALDSTAKRPTPFRSLPVGAKASGSQWKPVLTPQPVSSLEDPDEKTRRSAAAPEPPPGQTREVEPLDPTRTVLPEGAVIAGRYRIIRKLAAGGMGEVYQAEHIELHKQFAVKVMLPALSSDPEFVNRFKREAISASRIGQLNIIDISDFGQTEDEGRFYFVMEFLDGITIASLLHREGALPVLRMVNVALQVARALAAAHAQGIVHRDMKPENIMVLQRPGQPDFVKVLDFGVAKVAKGPGQGGQTQLGMVVGTPQYMSPEQAMGVAVDQQTDTYALGLIFFEMLTGQPTFHGDTASILMVKQVTEPAPPLPEAIAAAVPAALSQLIYQMLEKDPKARPPSMDTVVEVLENLQAHLRVGAKLPMATASGRFPATATPQALSPVRITSSGLPVAARPSGSSSAVGPQDLLGQAPQLTPSGQVPQLTPSGQVPQLTPSGQVPQLTPSGQVMALQAQVPSGLQPALAPPRSKTPLVLGAVAAVLLLAGGGYAMFGNQPPPKEQPVIATPPPLQALPPVEKPAEKVEDKPRLLKVVLDSSPTGAQVFRGDALAGVTPFTVELEKGQDLSIELALAGYQKEPVKLAPLSDTTLTIPLKKLGGAVKPKSGDKPAEPAKNPGLAPDPYGGQVNDLQEDPY
ncbi:MAG: protein kinase [Myxococcaceae bacterium]|nr:protein kinase [Myxococcaceae bacterium]